MTYATFNFEADSAKKADNEGSRINRTDKYQGVIKKAEFVTSSKGTQGIEFEFVSDDKEETNFTIWTFKADGEPLFGKDKVNAILACLKTRTMTPTEKMVEKYDFDLGQKVDKLCVVAHELENKRIGLLLQAEEYLNSNGQVKVRMNFVASFEDFSGFMAKEILEKKTKAEALPKAYERLMKQGDKKLQGNNNQSGASTGYGSQQNSNQSNGVDDDLPF